MTDETNKIEVRVLGETFGYCVGWDDVGNNAIQFYDFEPVDGYKNIIPACTCLDIDNESGEVTVFNEDGDVTHKGLLTAQFVTKVSPIN